MCQIGVFWLIFANGINVATNNLNSKCAKGCAKWSQ